MLAIRLQRLGRKAYPVYRLAVQEAQRHPSSGRVVAYVGTYNPHTKAANVNVAEAQKYLDNGAQPTPRVVKLLKEAGVKLPKWVKEFDANTHNLPLASTPIISGSEPIFKFCFTVSVFVSIIERVDLNAPELPT